MTQNGEAIHSEKTTRENNLKKERMLKLHCTTVVKNNIKWKKFIKPTLKSNPYGILKMKKLIKVVLKTLQEFDIVVDETKLSEVLKQTINSNSKFCSRE